MYFNKKIYIFESLRLNYMVLTIKNLRNLIKENKKQISDLQKQIRTAEKMISEKSKKKSNSLDRLKFSF